MTGTDRKIETNRVNRMCMRATVPPHIKTNPDPPLRGEKERKGPFRAGQKQRCRETGLA